MPARIWRLRCWRWEDELPSQFKLEFEHESECKRECKSKFDAGQERVFLVGERGVVCCAARNNGCAMWEKLREADLQGKYVWRML